MAIERLCPDARDRAVGVRIDADIVGLRNAAPERAEAAADVEHACTWRNLIRCNPEFLANGIAGKEALPFLPRGQVRIELAVAFERRIEEIWENPHAGRSRYVYLRAGAGRAFT